MRESECRNRILSDYVSTLPRTQHIRVGCIDGSGFFYDGTAEGFAEKTEPEFSQVTQKRYGRNPITGKRKIYFSQNEYKGVPLKERYVLEAYDSLLDDALIIRIDGTKNGEPAYEPKVQPTTRFNVEAWAKEWDEARKKLRRCE